MSLDHFSLFLYEIPYTKIRLFTWYICYLWRVMTNWTNFYIHYSLFSVKYMAVATGGDLPFD